MVGVFLFFVFVLLFMYNKSHWLWWIALYVLTNIKSPIIKTQNTAINSEISLVLPISQFSPTSTFRKPWFCFCSFFFFLVLFLSCQLQIATCLSTTNGTYQEHLWATERPQQGHLPPACSAAAADLQHSLKGIQSGERGTLCSRETGGTGL